MAAEAGPAHKTAPMTQLTPTAARVEAKAESAPRDAGTALRLGRRSVSPPRPVGILVSTPRRPVASKGLTELERRAASPDTANGGLQNAGLSGRTGPFGPAPFCASVWTLCASVWKGAAGGQSTGVKDMARLSCEVARAPERRKASGLVVLPGGARSPVPVAGLFRSTKRRKARADQARQARLRAVGPRARVGTAVLGHVSAVEPLVSAFASLSERRCN